VSGYLRKRALASVPVVVMSAKGEEAGTCFSNLASVVDILPKPFSPDALLAVVNHALEKRGPNRNPWRARRPTIWM